VTVFFTSDQHFGHERILELGSGRPFNNIREHNDFIVKQWVSQVKYDDVVYVLGDVAFGGGEGFEKNVNIFSWLPGVKYLVPGNHDKIWSGNSESYIDKYFDAYVNAGFIILPEVTQIMFTVDGREVPLLLSHLPYESTLVQTDKRAEKFKKQRPNDDGLPLLHGHTHSREMFHSHPLSLHVGVDATGFKLVDEHFVRQWLKGAL
jgi:calcineurin-like phosphoesterase family protein